jgi:hypothetical protein
MVLGVTLWSCRVKTCRDCGESKPLDQFNRKTRARDGRQSYCRPCHRARREAWESHHDGRREAARRRSRLKRTFGITPEDYDAMLAEQAGGCAICGGPPVAGAAFFDVDHDHLTGRVRGLLCRACNLGLGKFRDRPLLLAHAIRYLARSAAVRPE